MKNLQKGFAVTIVIIIMALLVIVGSIYIYVSKKVYSPNIDDNTKTDIVKNKIVNLSNQGLKSIPTSVFSKLDTEELNVSSNYLNGSIQAEIRFLTKLKILNASNNLMTGLPAEIGQLQNLEILDLSNNKLTGLPNELGNLNNLKILNLSGNQYSKQDLDYIRTKLPSSVNIIIN